MVLATVYLETTIFGHLTSRLPKNSLVAGKMMSTRTWWDQSRSRFEIYTSDLVRNEASRGDPEAAIDRLAMMTSVPFVPIADSAWELAELLLQNHALPAKARIDAVHLAIAATNRLEYLLTWNCKHLANAALRKKIEATCRELGYAPPIICTPLELEAV